VAIAERQALLCAVPWGKETFVLTADALSIPAPSSVSCTWGQKDDNDLCPLL